LPDPTKNLAERRLSVWRKAYALFDTGVVGTGGEWVGPFLQAGYRDPVLEPVLDNGAHPDMLAVTPDWKVVLEISCSPNKEFASVRSYAVGDLTPPLKVRLGDRPRKLGAEPFFVTEESGIRAFPPELNAINVYTPFDTHLPNVYDPTLRTSLLSWKGFPGPVSSYGLLALPESSIEEIKFQLAGVLRQIVFDGGTIEAESLADKLLGELAAAFSPSGKADLVRNVATVLERAAFQITGLSWDNQTRTVTAEKADSPQTRKAFSKQVAAWLNIRFLESFSVDLEDGEESDEDAGEEEPE
jgi:hypothetical protein